MLSEKKITDKTGQQLMDEFGNAIAAKEAFDPETYVKKHDLLAIGDLSELDGFCKEAIVENQKAIDDYKSGNEGALNFVVGQVMRKTRGKADPKEVIEKLKEMIQ
ncbi:hypothetical protein COV93_02115 [Candidatus Woesearchaeota archaeon CG11_big_fil_rev_8_21_14_0_20_43_8]|nr:MAG: hypothetical protein COV93_02115 [Candidatus Woesearchaeota archaeon CG11_big_fil_rev_8_21_14_0_20_43_8]